MSQQYAGRIVLENLHNTRDLGYLRTITGQQVTPRKLIRSGALALATSEELHVLVEDYSVRTVIDLRTPDEQIKKPDPQEEMSRVRFVDAPILGFSTTGITREDGLAGMAKTLPALDRDPVEVMTKLYPNMLLDDVGIKGFSRFFDELVQNEEGAVLWHCSAGKDRAGLASVLLLTVLEVPHSAIVADYLATNQYLEGRSDELKKLIPTEFLSQSLLQSLQVFNSASETFLSAGLKAVEEQYGSLDTYMHEALNVDADKRALLKSKYLS